MVDVDNSGLFTRSTWQKNQIYESEELFSSTSKLIKTREIQIWRRLSPVWKVLQTTMDLLREFVVSRLSIFASLSFRIPFSRYHWKSPVYQKSSQPFSYDQRYWTRDAHAWTWNGVPEMAFVRGSSQKRRRTFALTADDSQFSIRARTQFTNVLYHSRSVGDMNLPKVLPV